MNESTSRGQTSGSKPDTTTSCEEVLSSAAAAELKRLESQRRVTLTFFFVGLIFISIAIPITVTATIFGLNPLYGIVNIFNYKTDATYATILLRFPYSLVALIDPFLYVYSNTGVKEQLKTKLRNLFNRCRKDEVSAEAWNLFNMFILLEIIDSVEQIISSRCSSSSFWANWWISSVMTPPPDSVPFSHFCGGTLIYLMRSLKHLAFIKNCGNKLW